MGAFVSILISVAALCVSGYAAVQTIALSSVTTAANIAVQIAPTCAEYQARVLALADSGLKTPAIVAALNGEELFDVSDGNWYLGESDVGPGYDVYYEPRCGPIALFLGENEGE